MLSTFYLKSYESSSQEEIYLSEGIFSFNTNQQNGVWSFTKPDMINPQKGIDLINNKSIINKILFAVTIFQYSPLTRRVFYNIMRRERGKQHQQHLEH
jgi:hypothetical protein